MGKFSFSKLSDKKKLIVYISLTLVLFMVLLVILFSTLGLKKTDEKRFKDEYESLNTETNSNGREYLKMSIPSNNNMKYSSVAEIVDIFEDKESAVIYFGYAKCAYCRSAVPVLIDAASLSRLEEIYYLDTENLIEEDANKLYEILGDEIVMDDVGNKSLDVPLVIFVSNGNIVSYHEGTIFSQYSAYQKLDESQEQGLKEIYRYGIKDVINS